MTPNPALDLWRKYQAGEISYSEFELATNELLRQEEAPLINNINNTSGEKMFAEDEIENIRKDWL
jgi:hypothetical protein